MNAAPTPHEVKVLEVWSPTPTTRAIRVERPKGFEFQTSQAARLILRTGSEEHARPLSIASSPTRPHLEFAVRRSESEFKRAFFALQVGEDVRVIGPRGQMLHDPAKSAVFFAAGIGITPFRSMLQTIADEQRTGPVLLVYGASSAEEHAFRAELDELAARSPAVTIQYRLGHIDHITIRSVLAERTGFVAYLAGPPGFVQATASTLTTLGFPNADLRAEIFRGYAEEAPPVGPAIQNWDERYRLDRVEQMPWFYPELDPDLAQALVRLELSRGRALDVGTGPGTQAIELASRGFEVTGTDISETAVAKAKERAQAKGVSVQFVADDVLNSRLVERFDLIFDRGCFHVMAPERRADYVRAIRARLVERGYLFLKCFSREQPGTQGPHRFSPAELREIFGGEFEVRSIDDTVYQGTLDPLPKALFSVLRARG